MPFVRSSQIRLCVSSSSYSSIFDVHDLAELEDLLVPARRNVQRQATDAHRVVGQTRAAELLEQIENQLPLAEGVQEHRHRADVHRVGANPQAMAGDPLQLAQNRAHVARAARHLERHQLLDRLAVADVAGRRGDVVHPVGQQDDLRPVAVFAELLDPPVQVADHDVGVDHLLAVEPQHDPQHAVGARMLGAHVEHQLVGVEHRAVVNNRCRHYSISASSRACVNFNQSSGFSISSSPGPSSG